MGLFDAIAGQVVGAISQSVQQNSGEGGLMSVLGQLMGDSQAGGLGGLSGLVNAFQSNGLGDVVSSWIGTGQNLPISADQIASVLGNTQLQGLAEKFGFSTSDLTAQLSQFLPQAVDLLTPNGQLPEGGSDLLAQGLSMLKGFGNQA